MTNGFGTRAFPEGTFSGITNRFGARVSAEGIYPGMTEKNSFGTRVAQSIHPGMTNITSFGTRVPQSICATKHTLAGQLLMPDTRSGADKES